MHSIFNRSLTILLILFGSISLANAQTGATPQATSVANPSSWTWLQDSAVIFCGQMGNISSCNIGLAQIAPTTAGSVWVIDVETVNNVRITSVTGGGGTWVLCPNCHATDPNTGHSVDAAYNLTGNAGVTQNITITLSGLAGGTGFGVDFFEFLPPAGSTASLDDSGSVFRPTCTTCTGVQLNNITATDFILNTPGASSAQFWNSVTSPYALDLNGGSYAMNVSSPIPAPVFTLAPPGRAPLYISLAFKSTAGIFTPPAYLGQHSLVQMYGPTTGCNPSCTLTIPKATSSGNLLFLMAANLNNANIASVSGGGSWVVPSGSNTCRINYVQAGNNAFSCAYVLSSTAGATSVNVTLNSGSSTGFGFWEVASNTGSPWAFDTQGSHVNAAGPSPSGQALTITGKNDVIFSGMFAPGGSGSATYFPGTFLAHQGAGYILFNEASEAALLNSGPTAPTPIWVDPQVAQNTATFGIAFTSGGVSTAPNPPTGLTAIVH